MDTINPFPPINDLSPLPLRTMNNAQNLNFHIKRQNT
jgi:hypothetical protein